MDKYTLQEQAYNNGLAAGRASEFWHDVREHPFKPEGGKDYLVRRIMTANYATGEFTPRAPEIFRVDSHYKQDGIDVMYWAEIPGVVAK